MPEIVTPPAEIPRDRYGRPLVTPPEGGKPVAYTRCTSFIDVLDDKFNLHQWERRMVALGLADRPDLMLSVQAHKEDKKALNRICDEAKQAAKASAAATTGTALHALTEVVDRGDTLPILPESAQADLAAYTEATRDLKHLHIEQFCVLDTLKVGGTPDRIVEYGGQRYIADLKTGSIEWGTLKIAMQLAIYARSYTYSPDGTRGIHEASTTRGIVIHLPAGQAKADLHWIDIETGWRAVDVARRVRETRALKFGDLTEPFGKPERPSILLGKRDEARVAEQVEGRREQIARTIHACTTYEQVLTLWSDHEAEWTDELTEVAKAHIATLPPALAG